MKDNKNNVKLNLAKEDDRKMFLQVLKENKGRINITRYLCGVSKTTLFRYRKKIKEFGEEIEDAKSSQIDYVEGKLFELIDQGDVTAIIFFLKTKGRDRGYGEKYVPETEQKKELHKVDDKTVKLLETTKTSIVEALKNRGTYDDSLMFQIDLAATLYTKLQLLKAEIFDKHHHTVIVEKSREGNDREVASPLESQFKQYIQATQSALRALGMNTDSKLKVDSNDAFGDFMDAFKDDDQ